MYGGDQKSLVRKYMETCADVGFDILEVSTGFISLPNSDWLRLVQLAKECGLKVCDREALSHTSRQDMVKQGRACMYLQASGQICSFICSVPKIRQESHAGMLGGPTVK